MKLDGKLMMKWIDNSKEVVAGNISLELINKCVISLEVSPGIVSGFSVFEPRDLTGKFWEKLRARQERQDPRAGKFSLTAPPYLKDRLESIVSLEANHDLTIYYSPFVKIKSDGQNFILRRRIKVVNIDDSPVLLKFLKHSMEQMGFFEILAQESDPTKAVNLILEKDPDLVTMDIQMPNMTGVELIRELFKQKAYPVLTISSLSLEEGSMVFDALNSGAFDYLQKPRLEDRQQFQEEFGQKATLAVEGKVINSFGNRGSELPVILPLNSSQSIPKDVLWCLGASTGGTQALTQVFTRLPRTIPPTLVVQHIAPVFSRSFADSLNRLCPFTVKEAENGEEILPEHVYVAPGGLQMGVEEKGGYLYISLKDDPPVNRFKPSVDFLFDSVAKIISRRVIAGVLTGMGKDGANGLLELKRNGAYTFAQDEESCTVYGMPRVAYEIGATDQMVSLSGIAQTLWTKSLRVKKTA